MCFAYAETRSRKRLCYWGCFNQEFLGFDGDGQPPSGMSFDIEAVLISVEAAKQHEGLNMLRNSRGSTYLWSEGLIFRTTWSCYFSPRAVNPVPRALRER
jgi:hypothetical protein